MAGRTSARRIATKCCRIINKQNKQTTERKREKKNENDDDDEKEEEEEEVFGGRLLYVAYWILCVKLCCGLPYDLMVLVLPKTTKK